MHRSGPLIDVVARRLLFALLASLLVASGLANTASAYDPSRPTSNLHPAGGGGGGSDHRVALGIATPYGRDIAAFDSFAASIGGRRPAFWAIWSQWGNSDSRDFPTAMANALRNRGSTPIIWWEPVRSSELDSPEFARHRNITNGNHDAYIRQFARDARDFGGIVLLRFAHEANNDWFPWSINNFDNSPETFIAAWRHVHALFQQEGATNVRFIWSVARQSCSGGCNPYEHVYPGNAYVDVLGFSGYNWGAIDGKQWTSMYDLYRRAVAHMREISAKPIMVAETGSNSVGGSKADWIRDGYQEVRERLPQISSIVYLNADLRSVGHPDWRLSSPAAALAAYAQIAAMDEFSVRNPYRARKKVRIAAEERPRRAERRHTSQGEESEPKQPERGPRVHRGSEPDAGDDGQGAERAANKAPKKKRKGSHEPPAVLDNFSR